jgi:maleylpyruvate isomerase
VAGLEDIDVRRPSRLADWSIGHVLTHLARNAEAMCRRIEGAVRHELIEQYVGGQAGRQAEIEDGSGRSARELEQDVGHWSVELDVLFESLPDDVWDRPVRTVAGGQHPLGLLPFRRWREVEVHLVDLGLDFGLADLSDGFVHRAVPELIAGLSDRADQRVLVGWLLGRGPAPDLDPWG